MIVIAMIGILVALALPTYTKIRENSRRTALINDARQLGSAAQQYMLEHVTIEVPLTIDSAGGQVSGPLGDYLRKVSTGYSCSDIIRAEDTFTLAHQHVRGGADGAGALGEQVRFNADGSLYK